MGKSNKNKNKKRRRKQATATTKPTSCSNFFSDAGPGCYIARRSDDTTTHADDDDWVLEWEDVSRDDFEDGEEVPELAIDPEAKTLSVCNTRNETLVAYITVFGTPVTGRNGQPLPLGTSTDNQGFTRECVTLIVLCPPLVFCHLCHLVVPDHVDIFKHVTIESDVQEWNRHPQPSDEHVMPLAFPLQANNDNDSFLCTQGEGGQLTHFFSGNLHAIDFRCPVGTPTLAVADGTVVESKDTNTLTGIAVSNLFEWNTIMLQLDTSSSTTPHDPLFVEYVHIQKAFVQQGDKVTRGQVIGETGSVGFSPEPHLHFAAYRSQEASAPTVRVRFQSSNDDTRLFLPEAGRYYNAHGEQPPKELK
jgi:Peptidase family M23